MYSYEIKTEVEKRIKAGENLKQINEDTKISISTLRKWEKGIEIRKKAKRLIKEGKIEEARTEIGKLSPKSNKNVILSLETLIAKKERNRKKEKELLERQLKINPEDTKVMSSLIRIAREEENKEREKELLKKILALEPTNIKIIYSLLRIVRQEENRQEEKELLEKLLKIKPENVKIMSCLIKIAREEENKAREKELLERQLKVDPENVITIKKLIKIAKEEGNKAREKELLERQLKINPEDTIAMSELIRIAAEEENKVKEEERKAREKEFNAIVQARELIKKSDAKDMLNKIEEIKELIEGIDETLKVLVESEVAFKAKIYKQAEGYLKLHKKELKEDKIALKAINKALSIAQTKNKLYDPLKWKEIYDEYKKARDMQSKKHTTNEDNKKGIQLDEEER